MSEAAPEELEGQTSIDEAAVEESTAPEVTEEQGGDAGTEDAQ